MDDSICTNEQEFLFIRDALFIDKYAILQDLKNCLQIYPEGWHVKFWVHCLLKNYTVEPHYNEDLGTIQITLLYQVSHYIRVKKQRNIKSWDQQNYLVIRGLFYPTSNEVPLYKEISVHNTIYTYKKKTKKFYGNFFRSKVWFVQQN